MRASSAARRSGGREGLRGEDPAHEGLAGTAGGEGSVAGSVIGALIMTTIRAGCSQMGLANWIQEIGVDFRGLDGQDVTISAKEIKEVQPMGRSLMPEGLLATLTNGEIRDLLAFLGRRSIPEFRH